MYRLKSSHCIHFILALNWKFTIRTCLQPEFSSVQWHLTTHCKMWHKWAVWELAKYLQPFAWWRHLCSNQSLTSVTCRLLRIPNYIHHRKKKSGDNLVKCIWTGTTGLRESTWESLCMSTRMSMWQEELKHGFSCPAATGRTDAII